MLVLKRDSIFSSSLRPPGFILERRPDDHGTISHENGILRTNVFPIIESNVPSTENNRQQTDNDKQYLNMAQSSNKSKDSKNSFFGSMRKVIFIAQCFSLLSVQGFNSKDSSNLRFKWLSFRVTYSICIIIFSFSLFIFHYMYLKHLHIDFATTAGAVFHGSTTFILMTFLYYAHRWPALVHRWEAMELELSSYGYPSKMAFKINFITAFILITAFVEHVLSNVETIYRVILYNYKTNDNLFYEFSIVNADYVFSLIPYNFILSLYTIVVRLICTFSWNFLDLFIILITLSLAERFKQINMELYRIECKANISEAIWQRVRLDYNAMTRFTKFVDDEISILILLSFGNNLYFICLQLFKSIKPFSNLYAEVYLYWSFLYLIIRTGLVSFFCARINDQSKIPAQILYSVSSESYCKEVERFLQQVTTDHVAITGMRFFSITRNFLISIAGTIVTYEIIILQLNGNKNSIDTANNTKY